MQPKKTVEIDYRPARNVDAGPHRIVLRLGVRHHDVETIGCATLENYNQPLGASRRLGRPPCGTSQKAGHRRRSNDHETAVAKKDSTCNRHKSFLVET